MYDASGMLIGQPVPADPVFIHNEQTGKTIAFPSVAVMLMSDQIFHNLVTMLRIAVRDDMLDLMIGAGTITKEQAEQFRMKPEPLPEHTWQSPDASQAG
jgi:hypothetical protein